MDTSIHPSIHPFIHPTYIHTLSICESQSHVGLEPTILAFPLDFRSDALSTELAILTQG